MYDPATAPFHNPHKHRRVALITGANSGIGFYTALHLYLHGFAVYVAGRSQNRVERAIRDIHCEAQRRMAEALEKEAISDDRRWLGELHFLELDLLELESVEFASARLRAVERRLDLLILNAGVGALPYNVTRDGFEIQFQTNYVAQFLLTHRLLDLCTGRVVYVSSIANFLELFQFNRDWRFNYRPNFIFTWLRYSMSKNSGIQLMKFLAVTKPELKYYSVHPGFVMNTNFFSYWTRIPIFGICFWFLFQIFGFFAGCSNEEGACATLKCCLSSDVLLDENGSYFSTGGTLSKPGRLANDLNSITYNYIWTVKELKKRGYDVGT